MFAFVALAGLVGLVVFLVGGAIHNIALHPLSDVPGPRECAVSRVPYWYAYWHGRDARWIRSLHDKYGPVVRFGPNDLSYAVAQAWEDVNGPKNQDKAQEFSVQPVNGVPNMLTQGTENHARVRRLFAPAFSERALQQQSPLFRKYADLLKSKIGEVGDQGRKAIDIVQMLNFTTFDIMAELCFGQSLGLLQNNTFSPWVRSVFDLLHMMPIVTMIAYYPALKAIFDILEPKSVTEQRITHCKHAEDRVNKRLKEGSSKPDVWNLVLEAQEGKGLTLEEMHSNAELFMMAGSETTATLLSGCVYLLLSHPNKLQLLLDEIRGKFSSAADLTLQRLAESKYLNAVIRETMRVYPPFPVGSPRIVPKGGQRVLGRTIPAGTRVSVHHWATYMSEANFKDAEKFAPERWLKDPIYAGDNLAAHKPFSHGPRDCLGQAMAWHEVRIILATLLFSYDLELCQENKAKGWLDQQTFLVWVKKPLYVRAKPAPVRNTTMR